MDLRIWSEDGRLRVSAPPGVLTPELREELSARKAEVLDFLRETRAVKGQGLAPLEPVPRDRPLPLSFAQQRLWMVEQMNPGRTGYHVGLRLRLEGVLSVPALRTAVTNLVRRHESLRTRFPMTVDGPVQEIANDCEPELELLGFGSEGTWAGGEDGALANAAEEGQRPYDLANGPLVRWRLYRIDGELHLLWAGMHHIVTDGWSLAIMYRELAELYQAAVAGRQASLGPLKIQYPDFAAWQREWLSGEVLEKQLGYWRKQLTGAARLEFPADRSPPPETDIRGAGAHISLSPEVLFELKRLAKAEGATLFMTLLAGLQALLHRYTGQDDIVVGSPIANRNRSEVEGIVGFFVNALVLRTDLSGDPRFRDLLRRAKEVTLKAYEFQDMPFEKLVEDLAPERTWGQNPFIQVILSLQNLPLRQTVDAAGLKMSLVETKALTRRFELEFHLWEADGGLTGQVVYNPDRFDADTVERYIGHYCRLLEAAAKHPDRAVSELPMLSEREIARLLVEWNQTTTPYPRQECLPAIFDRWAESQPQAIAVTRGEKVLTYGELRERSSEFAHYLRARGVGEGSRVGVCMERSPEMICAVLGILRVGAAYVPLDPDYPHDRLHYMVKDADAKIVVTMKPLHETITNSGAEVISWRRDWPLGAQLGQPGSTDRKQESETVACILYTSGSTGTPKGVALLHQGIVRLVLNTNYLKLGPHDRMAHLSNVCFDAATFEIWGALLNGGRLVVIPKAVALDPRLFAEEIRRASISTLLVTTALFNELALSNPRIFASVEQVFFGGEAADAQRVRRVLEGGGAPG
ncbi:MAG TPA: condensation domain-containing protein, partial [Terrimicrobiaceae bacterium]